MLIRNAEIIDIDAIFRLGQMTSLQSLAGNQSRLAGRITRSVEAFTSETPPEDAEYFFVLEEDDGQVSGTCHIVARCATPEVPNYHLRVRNILDTQGRPAQSLQFGIDTEPVSKLAGLALDPRVQRLPGKRGKQLSLMRMLYLGMCPERFRDTILGELMPLLTDDGRNIFWESLGQKYTGLSYEQALARAAVGDCSFIGENFPQEEILLDAENPALFRHAGRVRAVSRPAQHIVEQVGFRYLEQAHPLDGGLQYAAPLQGISLVQQGCWLSLRAPDDKADRQPPALLAGISQGRFRGGCFPLIQGATGVALGPRAHQQLGLPVGARVYLSPWP